MRPAMWFDRLTITGSTINPIGGKAFAASACGAEAKLVQIAGLWHP
ncbi:hypothetical protein ACFQZI_12700 [Mucilaginibacter lutimaris]|uniref:Uncharacterized protein n=1 Tax=Mucilaginibacter lutimaris TaxID=931629 RepID=A0ABW2ZHX6_9SPHI